MPKGSLTRVKNSPHLFRHGPRGSESPQWVGVSLDEQGRLLQFIAVEEPPGSWLIFHCIPATKGVLAELGLGR
jgi:hypothetical protein